MQFPRERFGKPGGDSIVAALHAEQFLTPRRAFLGKLIDERKQSGFVTSEVLRGSAAGHRLEVMAKIKALPQVVRVNRLEF